MAQEKKKYEHLRHLVSLPAGPIVHLLTPISPLVRLSLSSPSSSYI